MCKDSEFNCYRVNVSFRLLIICICVPVYALGELPPSRYTTGKLVIFKNTWSLIEVDIVEVDIVHLMKLFSFKERLHL